MPVTFAHHELNCNRPVRTSLNDLDRPVRYARTMARRGIPKTGSSWYLSEWMDRLGVSQAEMIRRTDWSKATASQLYTGKQDYSPAIVKAAAMALHTEEWELLMPYEQAMALRRIQSSAKQIVLASDNTEKTGTNN